MNKQLSDIKTVIFDLDGTLWDPLDVVLNSWNDVVAREPLLHKLITHEELRSLFGVQHDLIGEKLFPGVSKADQNRIMEECFAWEIECVKRLGGNLYGHLEEVLTALSEKYTLCIVSNCQSGYIEAFFEYHKLSSFFRDFECSGNTGRPKGENIRSVIERNSLENCLYVGDTTGDQKAANDAGVPFIWVSWGFGEVEDADHSVHSLKDLTELLTV